MEYPETLMSEEQLRREYAKLLEINSNEIAENIRLTVLNAELLAAIKLGGFVLGPCHICGK